MFVSSFKENETGYAQNHNQIHGKSIQKIQNIVGQRNTFSCLCLLTWSHVIGHVLTSGDSRNRTCPYIHIKMHVQICRCFIQCIVFHIFSEVNVQIIYLEIACILEKSILSFQQQMNSSHTSYYMLLKASLQE